MRYIPQAITVSATPRTKIRVIGEIRVRIKEEKSVSFKSSSDADISQFTMSSCHTDLIILCHTDLTDLTDLPMLRMAHGCHFYASLEVQESHNQELP